MHEVSVLNITLDHCSSPVTQVSSATSYLDPLKAGAIGCASKTVNSKDQMALLDQSKTVIESMQNLILAAKEAGGNRKVGEILFNCYYILVFPVEIGRARFSAYAYTAHIKEMPTWRKHDAGNVTISRFIIIFNISWVVSLIIYNT